jgi:hypothetical protein
VVEGPVCSFSSSGEQDWPPEEGQADLSMVLWRVRCYVFCRVVYRIGIFRSVLVGISWYLPYRYRRKSRSVHFGIIFLAGTPFSLKKGALAPFLRKKGGTGPLFDTASPPFVEKRSSRQISNTDRKYQPPSKSDTGKIPIPKKTAGNTVVYNSSFLARVRQKSDENGIGTCLRGYLR